jgi:hypothetical protein
VRCFSADLSKNNLFTPPPRGSLRKKKRGRPDEKNGKKPFSTKAAAKVITYSANAKFITTFFMPFFILSGQKPHSQIHNLRKKRK